ncbi:MAG: hypothetical protein R2856_38410 [Caldilineaceae bacterium]
MTTRANFELKNVRTKEEGAIRVKQAREYAHRFEDDQGKQKRYLAQ